MLMRKNICQHFNHAFFNHYLKKKRKTARTLAKSLNISENSVCAWRTGKSKPTWRNLIKMAEILNITPRLLIIKRKQYILDKWEDHLIDYIEAQPGEETKLTTREALILTERLGYFDRIDNIEREEQSEAENKDLDLLDEGYDPLKDLVEEK